MDALLQLLSWHEEEGLLTLYQFLLTQLRLPVCTSWVQDYTVLSVVQSGDVHHTNHLGRGEEGGGGGIEKRMGGGGRGGEEERRGGGRGGEKGRRERRREGGRKEEGGRK